MYLLSAEGYKNTSVHFLTVRKTGKIWPSMKDVHKGLGVKNMSDLILREIYRIYETKSIIYKQTQKYKMTEREIFKKYDNLTEDELNTKINKNVYTKNDLMTTVIKRCSGEKKRRKKNRYLEKN